MCIHGACNSVSGQRFPAEEMHVGMFSEYYQVLAGVKTPCSEGVLQAKVGLSLSLIDIGDLSGSLEG